MGIKRRKSSRLNDNSRISSLPDDLKSHILSFLPYSDSVKTTVLSHRWKNLWAQSSTLQFSDSLSFKKSTAPSSAKAILFFTNYVDKVLKHHELDEQINKFAIRVSKQYGVGNLNNWLNWAVKKKVKILEFKVSLGFNKFLPLSRFHEFASIVDLSLSGIYIVVNFDGEEKNCLSFLNVKKLNLDTVKFIDNLAAAKFFSSCSNLEELDISYPANENTLKNPSNVFKLCINTPMLKRLTVQCGKSCVVRVYAPCLEYLSFRGYDWKNIRLEYVSPLVDAHVYLHQEDGSYRVANNDYRWKMLKRLKVIGLAKRMSIDFSYFQHIGKDFPMFHNLESLKLWTNPHGRRLLCRILENAPKLKHLSLSVKPIICKCEVAHYWRLPHSLPSCVLSCLESIEVICTSKEDISDFLKDVLKNATVLKRMKISAHFIWLGDLLTFPCASTTCQILPLSAQESESPSVDVSSSYSGSSSEYSSSDDSDDD